MNKEQVASVLAEIGTLLELQGENPFRIKAYQNGARAVMQMTEDLDEMVRTGRLAEVPGIGETLREKITALVTTGALPFYDDLRSKVPAGLLDMMRIQGMGPKKVMAVYQELGITTLDELKAACEDGRLSKLRGFGAKTQENILEGIRFLAEMGSRVRIDQASAMARAIIEGLRDAPGIVRMEVCGSLRRRRETIKDIDLLISAEDPMPIMDRFVALPGVVQVTGHGATKSSIVYSRVTGSGTKLTLNADLRVVKDDQFPFALHHFTGSKEHNVAMRARAQGRGLKMNEYELAGEGTSIPCKTEADIFRALGLDYIPPEMRENTGEIEAAERGEVPTLVELKDLLGTFHNHSTWSDGHNSVEEMVLAAKAMGLKYLGMGDHSKLMPFVNGMTEERARAQQEEIDALNKKLRGIRIFKGIECDVLEDGAMDYEDDFLATFDYVVASVHLYTTLTREEMTARMIRALRNPYVTMLGHASGRLLLKRDAYQVDLKAVLEVAAETGTFIEINADPHRLDLDWVHCKRAREMGVRLVINPDAHSTEGLGNLGYGIDVARRGWLEKDDVLNTRPAAQVAREFAELRKRKGAK